MSLQCLKRLCGSNENDEIEVNPSEETSLLWSLDVYHETNWFKSYKPGCVQRNNPTFSYSFCLSCNVIHMCFQCSHNLIGLFFLNPENKIPLFSLGGSASYKYARARFILAELSKLIMSVEMLMLINKPFPLVS